MINDRKTLILYSTAICNLNCVYCYIDKNPALQQVDQYLDQSFKTDYYVKFAQKLFPNSEQLEEIQIWGGEPTLNLSRIIPTIKQLLQIYPNLNEIMFSTNLAHSKAVEEINNFCLNLKADHPITLHIQLSIDGPEYITDANRGKGVTKKFSTNFAILTKNIDTILNRTPNLTINLHTKSTIDINCINVLQSKEKIIDYYKFLELFSDLAKQSKNPRFAFIASVPNTACPLPITKELGLKFANICKLCTEIEKENKISPIFKYYKIITPYKNINEQNCNFCNNGTCGQGKYCIGLLPNDMVSMCHNGFTELLAEYKEYAALNNITALQNGFFKNFNSDNKMIMPVEELPKFEQQIEAFYNPKDNNYAISMLGIIQLLALNNQIDSKYKNLENAKKAVTFIISHTAMCVRDNLNITGTKQLVPMNLLKLLLNGAKEYIEDIEEFKDDK